MHNFYQLFTQTDWLKHTILEFILIGIKLRNLELKYTNTPYRASILIAQAFHGK